MNTKHFLSESSDAIAQTEIFSVNYVLCDKRRRRNREHRQLYTVVLYDNTSSVMCYIGSYTAQNTSMTSDTSFANNRIRGENLKSSSNGVKSSNKSDFLLHFKSYVESVRPRVAKCTYRGYLSEISKLKKFRKRIFFTDMDKKFILKYESYMLETLNNKRSTINKTFRRIKSYLRQARAMGLMTHDPFEGYRLCSIPTNREALSWEELNKMEQLLQQDLKKNQKNVLKAFLFACYTGLRYIDVCTLQAQNIINGIIIIQTSKTGEFVRIPLSKRADALIEKKEDHLFKLYSNNKTNLHLKQIAERAGLSKKITFHIARHTFATISLNLGISMEVVSGLLGHKSIRTTQIYAKILDETKAEMIKKWDNAKSLNKTPRDLLDKKL